MEIVSFLKEAAGWSGAHHVWIRKGLSNGSEEEKLPGAV